MVLTHVYKEILIENNKITIYGSGRKIQLKESIPEWNKDTKEPEMCFIYRKRKYFISEFLSIHNKVWCPNPPEWMKEFDGYVSDSFFSGILIKLNDDDTIYVYTYISH